MNFGCDRMPYVFCRLAIFCVLCELIFAIRRDCFFLMGINDSVNSKHAFPPSPSFRLGICYFVSACSREFFRKPLPRGWALLGFCMNVWSHHRAICSFSKTKWKMPEGKGAWAHLELTNKPRCYATQRIEDLFWSCVACD